MVMGVGRWKESGREVDLDGNSGRGGGGTNTVGLWTLGAILLLILSVTVLVTALQDADSTDQQVDEEQSALGSVAAEAARPTQEEVAGEITRRLDSIVSDIAETYDATVGLSLRAGGGVVHVGDVEDARAWSSVKVPIALAAVQHQLAAGDDGDVDALSDDITLALTRSDNDAALRLWQSLGTDEESSVAVDGVFRQAGDPTDAEYDRGREDYGGFGDIHWTLDNQVIFANRLACLDGADKVLDPMGHVVEEHRRGLGLLPDARFKSGWGEEPDGSFLLREFGLVGAAGSQIPVALAVLPGDDTEATARDAAGALAEALSPVIADLAGKDGTAQCQVPESVPDAV